MHKTHLSILVGLTTTVVVSTPLMAQAASFDFNRLQNISSKPINSNYRLSLFGNVADNQGYTAFFNLDPLAPDFGHRDISLNASGNGAPYYLTGRQGSPEEPASGSTRTASVAEIAGFPTLSSFLNNNAISLSSIGFGYGVKSDRNFNTTWNLGSDILGQNWFASPDSTIEERIYTANPNNVESFLSFNTTKIINFDYSNIYSVLDYGGTTDISDDIDAGFTDPVKATRVAGLDPLADALADAFLQDVTAAGGAVQLVAEDTAVEEASFSTGNGFGLLNFKFVGSLRVGRTSTVPEPSLIWGIVMTAACYAMVPLRKTFLKK
ncbi:MAG: hypothetical protein KME50_25940 [Nostoc desertorum CM1-VF14]|jgi:hypothetical protein|nr:hypothetical protein [Nostoc desertorum CM1-VF14]